MIVRLDNCRIERQYQEYYKNFSNQLDQLQLHNHIYIKKLGRYYTAAWIKLLTSYINKGE